MMTDLESFLIENDVSNITKEIVLSERLPAPVKIKTLTKAKHGEFQKRCAGNYQRKKGIPFDTAKFQTLICIECCIYPDFRKADFLDRLGVPTPEDALNKTLLSGEIQELYEQICKLSGFELEDMEEDIEEAKN